MLQIKTSIAWNPQPWETVCREYFSNEIPYLCCQFLDYGKMYLWDSPVFTMILSLTLHVEQSSINLPKTICPPSAMKNFPQYFMGRDTMPLLHCKILWGSIPQYLQESAEQKLAKRIVRRNRSVSLCIM